MKKQRKPKAVYFIYDKSNSWWGQYDTLADARRWADKLMEIYTEDAPYTIEKYVREVKKKVGK